VLGTDANVPPIVRSQHLGDGANTSGAPTVLFTAPDAGVSVIKGMALSTLGTDAVDPASAYISVDFSGGTEVPIFVGANYGEIVAQSADFWIVLPAGSTVKLYGDGTNEWTATVDGAILVY
jgi:hypothetical protein